jgi:hypothetical protein
MSVSISAIYGSMKQRVFFISMDPLDDIGFYDEEELRRLGKDLPPSALNALLEYHRSRTIMQDEECHVD